MLQALIARFAATLEIKRRRLVASAVAGVFLLVALVFAASAGWLWLAGVFGAIVANLICAGALALVGVLVLATRPHEPKHPVPVAAPPVARSMLAEELIAAFLAGSNIGRNIRK
jgi:hypothetical protein